jgi:hypothetical protein
MTKKVSMAPVVHICSLAEHIGSGRDVAGKTWHWEYHSYLGPTFTNKRGDVLKNQPMRANHRAWKPFQEWLNHKKLKGDIK